MPEENRKFDGTAKALYDLHRNGKTLNGGWPNFFHLKLKERDYWRGLAQLMEEEGEWDLSKGPNRGERK